LDYDCEEPDDLSQKNSVSRLSMSVSSDSLSRFAGSRQHSLDSLTSVSSGSPNSPKSVDYFKTTGKSVVGWTVKRNLIPKTTSLNSLSTREVTAFSGVTDASLFKRVGSFFDIGIGENSKKTRTSLLLRKHVDMDLARCFRHQRVRVSYSNDVCSEDMTMRLYFKSKRMDDVLNVLNENISDHPGKCEDFFPEILPTIENSGSLKYSQNRDMHTAREILFSYEPDTPFKKQIGRENWETLRDIVFQQMLEN
jgi:hypothetical protein